MNGKWIISRPGIKSAVTLSLVLYGLFFGLLSPGKAALKEGEAAPLCLLPDLKGNLVWLPDGFKGKIVLIHFWASWCPYCIKEMVAIESLVLKFKGKGLAPFSINVGDRKVVAETYVAPLKISYSILLDPKSLTARKYGVTGIPTTFILDRQGILRFKIPGEIDQKGLERLLAKLL